jgi:hypothetical protein
MPSNDATMHDKNQSNRFSTLPLSDSEATKMFLAESILYKLELINDVWLRPLLHASLVLAAHAPPFHVSKRLRAAHGSQPTPRLVIPYRPWGPLHAPMQAVSGKSNESQTGSASQCSLSSLSPNASNTDRAACGHA